jgi:hypothetical protein
MTQDERIEAIEAIGRLPDLLDEVARSLDVGALDTSYREGGWTRRQVIHHIADSHLMGYSRMKLILTEEYPTLKPYDQDEWAKMSDSSIPIESSLALVRGLHGRWHAMLKGVSEDSWELKAYHPEDGEVVLEDMLRKYARHGEHHLQQIRGSSESGR